MKLHQRWHRRWQHHWRKYWQTLAIWPHMQPDQRAALHATLRDDARIDRPYLVLVVAACAIATFGLLANSTAVIIGAMIIAPLMLPIRSISWAVLVGDWPLFWQGLLALGSGVGIAIGLSAGLGHLVGIPVFGSEVLARGNPNLLDLGVALVAGAIGAYALVQPKVSGTVAGTAIAVALMPPACTVGLALAQGSGLLAQGALLLLVTNLCGIALAGAIVFGIVGGLPWGRARRALGAIVAMTLLLAIPLTYRFWELVRQAQLEANLRRALLDRTVTFQRLSLIDSHVNWLAQPPEVQLTVRSAAPISPKQVQLLEIFLAQTMHRPFKLIFLVSELSEVRSSPSPDRPQSSP
jgi:uncharacterized hydrophobic protein (TIGR00271 family)